MNILLNRQIKKCPIHEKESCSYKDLGFLGVNPHRCKIRQWARHARPKITGPIPLLVQMPCTFLESLV